jgi:hypothetical protein
VSSEKVSKSAIVDFAMARGLLVIKPIAARQRAAFTPFFGKVSKNLMWASLPLCAHCIAHPVIERAKLARAVSLSDKAAKSLAKSRAKKGENSARRDCIETDILKPFHN